MVTKLLKGFPPFMEKEIKPDSPTFLGIHLKPVCNFRCRKCFIGEQKRLKNLQVALSLDEIFKIMENAKKAGAKVFGITGAGEPSLDNRFKKIIKYANKLGFITHVATNISFLNKNILEFLKENNVTLVLSVDAIDKDLFVSLTRTNYKTYEKVMKGIKLAQEVYKGTKRITIKDGKKFEIYRIAIHMTVHNKNIDQIEKIKKITMPDTLFSLSPMAYIGFATCNFDSKEVLKIRDQIMKKGVNEKHIVIVKEDLLNMDICGFFRFGVDINFDGQLLLDAHTIETRKLFKNIRDFDYNLKAAYEYLLPIKLDFINEGYMSGFCPVRSPRLSEWIRKRKELLQLEKTFRKDIIKDIKEGKPLLKYAYLGEGAERFLDVLRSPEYHTYRNELNLINSNSHTIKNHFEENVIVLGVGNGEKLFKLLQDLNSEHVFLVDISKKLIDISLQALGRKFKIIHTSFEKLKLSTLPKKVTFLLFGGTLVNMPDWDKFLKKLKKIFPKGNIFLGLEFVQLNKPDIIKKIIKEYDNETGFRFVFHPLYILGFTKLDGHLDVDFNYDKSRIEEYFILNSRGRKKLKSLGLLLRKKILLSTSIKLDENKFFKGVERLGFKVGSRFKHEGNHIIELKF